MALIRKATIAPTIFVNDPIGSGGKINTILIFENYRYLLIRKLLVSEILYIYNFRRGYSPKNISRIIFVKFRKKISDFFLPKNVFLGMQFFFFENFSNFQLCYYNNSMLQRHFFRKGILPWHSVKKLFFK